MAHPGFHPKRVMIRASQTGGAASVKIERDGLRAQVSLLRCEMEEKDQRLSEPERAVAKSHY
jgi:hypothetical protein